MKPCNLHFLLVLLLSISIVFSCRRADRLPSEDGRGTPNSEDYFFNSYRSADPTEQVLVDFFKRADKRLGFVPNTLRQVGLPRWDKLFESRSFDSAARSSSDPTTTYYIPFARPADNRVNACLVVNAGATDTTFFWLCDWQYEGFVKSNPRLDDTAARFAVFFMVMDKDVFGHKNFNITDGRLFKSDGRTAAYLQLHDSASTSRIGLDPCISSVLYFQRCSAPGSDECTPVCDLCSACIISVGAESCFSGTGGSNGGGSGPWIVSPHGTGGSGGSGTPPNNGSPPECNPVTAARCGPGWNPKPQQDSTNPCVGAKGHAKKAGVFAASQVFQSAAGQIQTAINANPLQEHAIAFGLNGAGNPTPSQMNSNTGGHANVPAIANCFADLHNHRGNTEPSAGDLYGLINQNTPTNGYDTRYVMTGGTVYAFVIYNADSADSFRNRFPPDQIGNNPPEFPDNAYGNVYTDYLDARNGFRDRPGYSRDYADALGMAYVLEKYKAGISILRQETNGIFKILRVGPASSPGSIYNFDEVPCN